MNRELAGETAPHFIAFFVVFLSMYKFGRQNRASLFPSVYVSAHVHVVCECELECGPMCFWTSGHDERLETVWGLKSSWLWILCI